MSNSLSDPLRPSDHADGVERIAQPRLGLVGWLRWGWRQLTSMRTALVLLLLLAIAAIPAGRAGWGTFLLLGGTTGARDDDGAGLPEDSADAGTHAAYAARDEDDLPRQTQIDVRHAC